MSDNNTLSSMLSSNYPEYFIEILFLVSLNESHWGYNILFIIFQYLNFNILNLI